jgi:parallel beta-helix repeat protein
MGSPSDNIVRGNVSFENLDISDHRSDGSGYIVDQNSEGGAIFENNIGFHNGGSCIRITKSSDVQLINNTCIHNGQDANLKYHDEIFYSDGTSRTNSLLLNNLCIPTDGQRGLAMGDGVNAFNNIFDGTDDLVVSTSADLDFHLQQSASSAIDQGGAGAPATDIGFDWRCIKQEQGVVSWWQFAVDYDYIESIGGVAACFNPRTRDSSPDIGSYEFGETDADTDADSDADSDSDSDTDMGSVVKKTGNPGFLIPPG